VSPKVFSPQYLLWLLPVVPLVVLSDYFDRMLQQVFVAAVLLTMCVYPIFYHTDIVPSTVLPSGFSQIGVPSFLGLILLTMRNLAVVWMTILLWRPDGHSPGGVRLPLTPADAVLMP
jgi:hypothetical protein